MLNNYKGEPPWSEFKTSLTALYKILHTEKPPEIPNFLSPQCTSFLNCCLKINPKERSNVYKLLRHPIITNETIYFFKIPTNESLQKVSEDQLSE